ncbi:MAG: VWA domain-containing protein [Oscillospiraceae bacterium]|nr:VWA domain-containing protein [Oscillospiraceae bacterium]
MKQELNQETNRSSITELVFILDRSGSMAGLESDTIGGFNAMLEKQKKQDGLCWVSTVLFANESQVIHDRVRLEEVRPMTADDYSVGGCTALIDAIGDAIRHIGNVHKYARPEDVPAHTVFVITTDGMENASHRYSAQEVRQLISRKQEQNGWEFLFIGANIDAVQTAGRFGIAEDRAVNYRADRKGTRVLYECVSRAVGRVRANAPMEANWSQSIQADYESRKR